ncbi:hypothetical protein [Blastococcus sp. CT_GayMR16]|nr:hypothetical protein [Blastococcus sp. CT_GayMR16]
MPDPVRIHSCHPIWVPGAGPIGTCPEHYRQPIGITAAAATSSAGAR